MRILLAIAILLITGLSAEASPGVDLALVFDRSQSMSPYAPLTPEILRLAASILARNGDIYAIDHRIAVVTFASSAVVDLPWTEVRTSTPPSVRIRRAAGSTDILAALRAAERLFASLPRDPSRRRAIVVVTDGVPSESGANTQRSMAALWRQVAIQGDVIPVEVVLVARAAALHRLAAWPESVGVHAAGITSVGILATVHGVVTRLCGTASVESAPSKSGSGDEHIIVPPYLEVIVFDIFGAHGGDGGVVFAPGSQHPLRDGVDGVEVVRLGDILETMTVFRPQPGNWIVRKFRSDSDVRVRSQQFFPRGVLLQPDVAMLAATRNRIRIAYQVLDEADRPIEELREYPLSLHVTVASPDGRKLTMAMERDESLGRAAFRTTEETDCRTGGQYWTDVRVLTQNMAGRPLEIFRDRWAGFNVDASVPLLEASVMPRRMHAAPRSLLRDWRLITAAIAVLTAGAVVRLRKPKRTSSCLSERSRRPDGETENRSISD